MKIESNYQKKKDQNIKRVEDVRDRLERFTDCPPAQIAFNYQITESYIKLAILTELITEKKVDLKSFSLELVDDLKGLEYIISEGSTNSYIGSYNIASRVVIDYNETGGQNTYDGTGLK